MSADYIPKSLSNLQAWLKGLETGITNDGATLGRSPAQITSDTALVDSILTPVSDALGKETAAIESAGLARSILAEVALAGVLQGLHKGAGLLAIKKRLIGMLNVTAVFGGNSTTPGLDFAITIDLRQGVNVTTHTGSRPQAELRGGSGAMNKAMAITASATGIL